jgi:UDP-glucose 4-epimerase
MRALVTGGAGFIGSHVCDALLAAGHTVTVLDDLSTGRAENVPKGATLRRGDLRDRAFLTTLFDEVRPEVVCHQAAQTSVAVSAREPVRDAQVNVVGSLELLQQCVRLRVARVVYASTGGAVYGEVPDGERATIEWAPRPLSPYAVSKLAVEHYLRGYQLEHGLPYTVLRYANVYGPRQDPHGEAGVVAIFGRRLIDGQAIQINARKQSGDEGCVRDYVYVGDVVRWNMLAIDGAVSEPIVNVCTGRGITTLELARAMAEALGVTPQIGFGDRRPGDVERSVLASDAAHQRVAPTELRVGLSATCAWLRGT